MSLTDNPDGPNVAVTGGAMPAADLSQTAMSSANNNALTSNLHTPESQAVADALIDTSQQEAPPPDHAPPDSNPATRVAAAAQNPDVAEHLTDNIKVEPVTPCSPPPTETILERVEDEAKVIIADVEAVVADVVHEVEHLATEAKQAWDSHQQKHVTPPTT